MDAGAADAPAVVPLARAHAHNDYEHRRPLVDALEHGFMSVEADVHLVDGQLLVAHDRAQVQAGRTLEALYLAPLRKRVARHEGRVYAREAVGGVEGSDVGFILLIDFKSGAEATYAALKPLLERYREMLTSVKDGTVRPGAVTVIISGARPVETLAAEAERWAFIDGRRGDLEKNPPASLVPLISESWLSMFSWLGSGEIPEADRRKLDAHVATAHAQGRRVRFWATGEGRAGREVLHAAGVDLLNTDDLGGLREFLLKKAGAE